MDKYSATMEQYLEYPVSCDMTCDVTYGMTCDNFCDMTCDTTCDIYHLISDPVVVGPVAGVPLVLLLADLVILEDPGYGAATRELPHILTGFHYFLFNFLFSFIIFFFIFHPRYAGVDTSVIRRVSLALEPSIDGSLQHLNLQPVDL